MTLYLDTEFNGHGGKLISLALVSDVGPHQFYGELPLPSPLHPWVQEFVIPHLHGVAEPPEVFRMRCLHFLERYNGEEIIADWPDDFRMLMYLMDGPTYEQSWVVPCSMHLIKSGDIKPEVPHNALSDATALMHWHVAQRAA